MPTEHFGTWLKAQLRRREMSGSDLARKINRPPSMVNRWVAGDRIPSPDSCDLIADALAIDLDTVLARAGHRPATERIDPDSPKAVILGLVNRVDWSNEGQFKMIAAALRAAIDLGSGERP